MRKASKKQARTHRVARPRKSHGRQRQRLIDACISALHIYGPSRTTVEKVVAFAKMSPGIVRFYFASKAAMLVASLQFLSTEFEEQLLVPVARLKSRPVAALKLLVDLYLDPEIASPRKVSVWYAFWGEASSRQEYYDICGQKDESFAALVRDLIERLIIQSSQPYLDPDGIALGLIGVLEILWQDFAFRAEADIDRDAAKRRAMAYLRSIFPGQFVAEPHDTGAAPGDRLPGWVYADERVFAAERDSLFPDTWQVLADRRDVPLPGDFLGVDLGFERVLLVRDEAEQIRAFRNSCGAAPHGLNPTRAGRMEFIQCSVHGLDYGLDGKRRGAGGTDLRVLPVRMSGDLILVRSADGPRLNENGSDPWTEFSAPAGSRSLGPPAETMLAADWKLIVEQWLEAAMPAAARGWSARRYSKLLSPAADFHWPRRFFAPNQLIELRPDGWTILQVLPVGPGRSLLRTHDYTVCEAPGPARAAAYLASRIHPRARHGFMAVAESTQKGLVTFGHQASEASPVVPAAAAFRRQLMARVPIMALARAPNGPRENSLY
jgi:AcrR family transcriptional regulator/nitrite reductase/ring-hydroxylating ferredoxin subunit